MDTAKKKQRPLTEIGGSERGCFDHPSGKRSSPSPPDSKKQAQSYDRVPHHHHQEIPLLVKKDRDFFTSCFLDRPCAVASFVRSFGLFGQRGLCRCHAPCCSCGCCCGLKYDARRTKWIKTRCWQQVWAVVVCCVFFLYFAWKMGWMKRSLFAALWGLISSSSSNIGVHGANSTPDISTRQLVPFALKPLPLGSIRPRGWLDDNLQLMANGLAGHMYEFYHYVKGSPWLGGKEEYSFLGEAFPYWLNGIVPLAYSLDDARLKTQISEAVDYVLSHQASDGWLGPEAPNSGLRNLWARFPLLLGFIQLLEADSATYGTKVLPALRKFVRLSHGMLSNDGSGMLPQPGDKLDEENHGWGRVRMADMMLTVQWLFENDQAAGRQQELLETMDMLRKYSLDWADWYNEQNYIFEDLNNLPESRVKPFFAYEHGVNVGQGLKAGAVINRLENNASMTALARRAVDWTFKYHGSASGTILADERLQGLSPYYGAELCTTVETMYSLSYLYQAMGDTSFADQAEKAAFNALPAAVMGDWWAHQYITQPNQPHSRTLPSRPFWNVNENGTTFGLEPNYPCCTVNHPQGYPKFLANSWVTVGSDGLGHAFLSPSAVKTTLGNGAEVSVEATTNYPFEDTLSYEVTSSAPFTLHVRIPTWADKSTSSIMLASQKSSQGISVDSRTGLLAIPLLSGKSSVSVTLARSIYTVPRQNGAVAIMHGPLLYTLDVGYNAKPRSHGPNVPENAKDWEILPTKPWNVAVDTSTLEFKRSSPPGSLPSSIWSYGAPPTYIEARGCEIDWPMAWGGPGAVPMNPKCKGKPISLRFIPVGSAKIGMVELPTIKL